jgi:hypothetical protein
MLRIRLYRVSGSTFARISLERLVIVLNVVVSTFVVLRTTLSAIGTVIVPNAAIGVSVRYIAAAAAAGIATTTNL